jgi:hypothetical protein
MSRALLVGCLVGAGIVLALSLFLAFTVGRPEVVLYGIVGAALFTFLGTRTGRAESIPPEDRNP